MSRFSWTLHGDGRTIGPDGAVAPDERLTWPRTIGIGVQHVLAMFGATVLVPAITGFPVTATLFFSAVGTFLFLIITRNKVPSYLGSSFAFLAPLAAAGAMPGASRDVFSVALGGVIFTGLLLVAVGFAVHYAGTRWIERLMPPVVTGAVVALIGLNLAGAAGGMASASIGTAGFTLLVTVVAMVLFKGFLRRIAILLGAVVGGFFAWIQGEWDFAAVTAADWLGTPDFIAPSFDGKILIPFIPVVVILVAENIGHLKSVSSMTGRDMDPHTGRALIADGVATTIAGTGGGSGTTTYAENIGVMAATRVYSTIAYWVAGATALLLSFSPKFGELIHSIPVGVLGGLATLLFGMIAILGARIWVQNRVDFSNSTNLATAAVAIIVGAANYTWVAGDLEFTGIALGTATALIIFHLMQAIGKWRGTQGDALTPERDAPTASAKKAPAKRAGTRK